MKEERHNGIISLWKFLFALVIAFFHGNGFYENQKNPFFYGGYIAVEFFFIVSGFYFAKKVMPEAYKKETIGIETIKFILEKIKSLFPYILPAYSIAVLLQISSLEPNQIANSIWNLFLLRELGFRSVLLLPQLWYLTAMLASMFILYPFLKRYKENFVFLVSPILIALGLGYLSYNWLSLDHTYQIWNGFTRTGMIRGMIEINMGMLIYVINQRMKTVTYTKIGRIFLTILGEGLLLMVLIITDYMDAPKYYDYIMLFSIAIAIQIIVSEKTLEYEILSQNLFYYVEKLSLPIFINHIVWIKFIDIESSLSKINPLNQSLLAVICTIIFSILELALFKCLKKKGLLQKIKKCFIKSEKENQLTCQ